MFLLNTTQASDVQPPHVQAQYQQMQMQMQWAQHAELLQWLGPGMQ